MQKTLEIQSGSNVRVGSLFRPAALSMAQETSFNLLSLSYPIYKMGWIYFNSHLSRDVKHYQFEMLGNVKEEEV